MRKIGSALLAGLFCVFLLGAADTQQQIHFPLHGFSIDALEGPADTRGMLMSMSLPASDGFAPNVNLISQNSPGTIDQYIEISKQQVTQNGWTLIKANKVDDNTAVMEITGKVGDNSLHFYDKVSRKGDEVILITATATENQWTTNSAQLEACVDSFQRDSDK
jgi:hypothetical protein